MYLDQQFCLVIGKNLQNKDQTKIHHLRGVRRWNLGYFIKPIILIHNSIQVQFAILYTFSPIAHIYENLTIRMLKRYSLNVC